MAAVISVSVGGIGAFAIDSTTMSRVRWYISHIPIM